MSVPGEGDAFPFGLAFQRVLVRLLMLDEAFCHKACGLLRREFFPDAAMGWFFETCRDHYDRHRRPASDVALEEAIGRLDPALRGQYAGVLVQIQGTLVGEREFVIAQLTDFVQRNIFVRAYHAAQGEYNAGRPTAAYDLLQKQMDEIRAVSFDDVDRVWYFEDFPDRMARRYLRASSGDDTFSTGFEALDEMTDGGIHRGEVWCWIAYAKHGKSSVLSHHGYVAVRALRKRVAHILLEGSCDAIAGKYDARWGGALYSRMKRGDVDAAVHARLVSEFATMKRLLVIRRLNGWDNTILNVHAELADLKSQGFVPDMVVLDYGDLLQSRKSRDGTYLAQGDAFRDLKSLADMLGVAIWTASQVKRPTSDADEREHILQARSIADSWQKVMVCDFLGSLNWTTEERRAKETNPPWSNARLYPEMYRENEVGRTIPIQIDWATMTFRQAVL